ncbi:MAG: ROK family protein [Lentisphaeria bacterium]
MNDRVYVMHALFSEIVRNGSVSRSQLSRTYGLRPATLVAVVERMKKQGFLQEPDRQGRHTGRRASDLMLNPKAGSFIGLELTPSRIYAVRMNAAGEEEKRQQIQLPAAASSKKICSLLLTVYQDLRLASGGGMLGFADPGAIDLKTGRTLQTVNLPAWEKVQVFDFFRNNTADQTPLLAPETLVRTYAEYLQCTPDFPETLFHARFSEGIGGGFINKGELLIGNRCSSMELGHLVLSPTGRRCRCGNRGCLEAMAGAAALRQMMQELVASGVSTRMEMNDFTLEHFVQMANENDRAAQVLAQETCERIGPVLAMVTTLLNPQIIVLSGELAGLGNLLLDAVKRAIALRCLNNAAETIKIKISTLDEFAGARTAALLRRNIFLEKALQLRPRLIPPLSAGMI